MVLNEVIPNSTNNSQVPPASVADTSYSQGNSSVVYEDVAEQTSRVESDQSYIVTQCPAYLSVSAHGQTMDRMYEKSGILLVTSIIFADSE